jgi:hypothetical protein
LSRVVQQEGVFDAARVPASEPLLAIGQGTVPYNIIRPAARARYVYGGHLLS